MSVTWYVQNFPALRTKEHGDKKIKYKCLEGPKELSARISHIISQASRSRLVNSLYLSSGFYPVPLIYLNKSYQQNLCTTFSLHDLINRAHV